MGAWAVAGLLAVVALVLGWRAWGPDDDRMGAAEVVSETASAVPTAVLAPSPTATVAPEPTATPMPTPTPSGSPSGSEGQVGTVLFGGGPARGPWQQIGTVAEITHPGAPSSASYAYREFWSDPEEENQSDELWDRITIEVAAEAVQLGEPLDGSAFGAAEGTEAFNAVGGVAEVYPDDGVFTALWQADFVDADGVGVAAWGFVIDGFATILHQEGPFILREGEVTDLDDIGARQAAWLEGVLRDALEDP